MAELDVKGGNTTATAIAAAKKPRTITLTFGDEDVTLYDEIVSDAKADRRSPSLLLVLWLSEHYGSAAESK